MRTAKHYLSFAPYLPLLFVFVCLLLLFILPAPHLFAAPSRQADADLPPALPKATPFGMATPAPVATKKTAVPDLVCEGMPLPTVTTTQPAPVAPDASQPVSRPLPTVAVRSSEDVQKAVDACLPVMRVVAASAAERGPDEFPIFEEAPDAATQQAPYKWIVHVITKFKGDTNKVYHCTGFLLNWRTVGTAAHCVFTADEENQIQLEVEYIAVIGYGIGNNSVSAKVRHTWKAWTVYQNYGWDFALLDLGVGSDNKIEQTAKFAWVIEDSVNVLHTNQFEVAGYPCIADNACGALHRAKGFFDDVSNWRNQASTILYAQGTIDKGQSGSGALRNNTVYAVLSHRSQGDIGFTRLHCGMKKLIDQVLTGTTQSATQNGLTLSGQTNRDMLGRKLYLPLIKDSCEL